MTGGDSLAARTRALLVAAMVAVSAILLLVPVNDPDFFWHLKTGEWIREHRALPAADPFSYTSPVPPGPAQLFTLRAYWLSQLLFDAAHRLGGIPGIVALKLLLAALLVAPLLRLRGGDPVAHAALVLATLPMLYRMYPFDRPQVFSFLCFAALLVLVERERTAPDAPAGAASLLPIPLLMLLWANLHGGHVIGQATLLLVAATEGAKFLHPFLRPLPAARYRRLALLCAAGVLASFANPNTWHAPGIALTPPTDWIGNLEYQSTVEFFPQQRMVAVFWGALALTAFSCALAAARPDLTALALLAVLGYEAFVHVRYIPFFMIAALPTMGSALTAQRLGTGGRLLLAAGAVALAGAAARDHLPTRERLARAMRVNEYIYPVRAADFVLAAAPAGKLYNTYFWGGYLLWRLAPERKVYVDGRGLSPQAIFQSFTVNMGFASPGEPVPLWAKILWQNDVGYLIVPRIDSYRGIRFDEVPRLRAALLTSDAWVPVFADPISLVFVRNTPKHANLIRRHAIPREQLAGR